MLAQALNLIGLIFITVGGIGAAVSAPTPQYDANGSVGLSGISEKEARIAMHYRQKRFPHFLKLVAIGALLQVAAIFL